MTVPYFSQQTGLLAGLELPPEVQDDAPALRRPQSLLMPPESTERRSLLGRIQDTISSGLLAPVHAVQNASGAVRNFADRQAIGDAPAGFEGLLTPEQIQAAKPSLGQALFGATPGNLGSDMWRKNLESIAQVQQAGKVMQSRRELFEKIGAPKDGNILDPSWVAQALPWALKNGDIELAKVIAPSFNELLQPAPGANMKADVFVDPKGNQHFITPKQGTEIPEGWRMLQSGGDASSNFDLFKMPDGKLKYIKKGSDLPPGAIRQTDAMAFWKEGEVSARDFSHRQDQAFKEFRAQTSDLTKAAPVLNQALLTIQDARSHPDPRVRKALFTSAIANFVQAADPKAQIRWQLLNYFKENINASAEDRVRLLVKRLKDGTLPDSVLYGMLAHLNNVRDMMREEYTLRRGAFLKERPDLELDERMRDSDALFPGNIPGVMAPGAHSTTANPAGNAGRGANPFADLIPPRKP